MYQTVFYDYNTYTYHIRDDKEGWVTISDYKPTYYERVPNKTSKSLPVLTGGWAEPTKKYDKDNPNLLEKDINKELLILRDLYYEYDEVIPSYHNILFLDIEIEMGGALTPQYIQSAPMPITSIAVIDKTLKKKTCFIIDGSNEIEKISEENKLIIPCLTEKDLIYQFLQHWKEADPTIVTTWNGDFFDIPYLYYRIKKVMGENVVKLLSPLNIVSETEFKGVKQIRIAGVNHLDYMLLFKKYLMKEEPSYKLGDIGEKYVQLGKIEYEGNLNQLFKKDKNLFIDYNLRDVEILEKLENKMKFIELTILISHICNIPYEQIYHNTVMNEGAILKILKQNNIVSPNKPITHNPFLKGKETKYAGGYIKEPVPGLYYDVIDLDFTSLYPSIIKSLNLGIETLVGRIVTTDNYQKFNSLEQLRQRNPEEIIQVDKLNKTNYNLERGEITVGELILGIEKNNYTISASGAFFRTDKQSIVSKILEGWFEKREHYRALKKKAGKAEDWDNYNLYDLFQFAFKILQNAMYGTFAKNAWRFTDGHMICSAAITNSGQRLTEESIIFTNKKINKELNQNKDYVCISDTDSMYIVLGDLLNHRYNNLYNKDKKILELASEIQDEANKYLNDLTKNLFNIKNKHYFQLKQEVIAKSILVTGKRRYAMYITNKEGVTVEELDLKGIELMKSNMNKIFRKFGEELVKDILFGKDKDYIDNKIVEFYKSLKNIDAKKIAKPTGVQYINSYISRKPTAGSIFSDFLLKAPANTKAAVRYNDLLKFKKLDKKYESIIENDKIYIVDLKPNPYQIETIAIPNSKIPEDIDNFIKEYIDIDGIFESALLNKLESFYGDLGWKNFPSLKTTSSKFFKFF